MRFTVLLIPDVDEGGYTATVPVLPGCITEGNSLEETMENVRDAIRLYLEDLAADGQAPPKETAPPELLHIEI